jgi:hypothetical protein
MFLPKAQAPASRLTGRGCTLECSGAPASDALMAGTRPSVCLACGTFRCNDGYVDGGWAPGTTKNEAASELCASARQICGRQHGGLGGCEVMSAACC